MKDWIQEALYSTDINTTTATFRLLLSVLIGGVVGLERKWRQQPAGFRTHILICLGATLLMMLSIYVPQQYGELRGDPGRIAAQVITGIGFLGAGAVIKIGSNIKGLTTAASIWMIAAIGMGIGAGLYVIAGFAAFLMLFILIVLERFERRVVPIFTTKVLSVSVAGHAINSETILAILRKYKIVVQNMDIRRRFSENREVLNFTISFRNNLPIDEVIDDIGQLEYIESVELI